ncbi:MAG TPA: DUF1761 domain-containing protein [Candidatus Paceibacterota bacterium]|nr:DUF1761 domain-containing protein [Candidatus Paceibacterota bacterium]
MAAVPINYAALLVAAVISVALGFLWYGPLFGKKWMTLTGIPMPAEKPPFSVMVRPMVMSVVGSLFMAFALIHNITFGASYLNMSGACVGLFAAFWNWLGFVVPPALNHVGWEGKPWTLFWINTGYFLVYMAIIGAMLAVWQ